MKKGTTVETRSMAKKRRESEREAIYIPLHLIIEILVKLPPKSIAKFMIVSSLWYSKIREKRFRDLYLARSLTRPCFLLTSCLSEGNQFFHSASHEAPSALDQYSSIQTILTQCHKMSQPVRGLICVQNGLKMVICNPSTGQVVDLPDVETRRRVIFFFGYDSDQDEYKVLCMTVLIKVPYDHGPIVSEEHQVFTLGDVKKRWRRIKCQHPHYPLTRGFFMNGIVYYGAWSNSHGGSFIVAFDVGLEEFSVVKLPEAVKIRSCGRSDLVNYHKKIALVDQTFLGGELDLWVLEDVEKQEWSKIHVVVPSWNDLVGENYYHCMGTISTGELIFAPCYPYYCNRRCFMVYYDLKENDARRVEIKGFGDPSASHKSKTIFLDHVLSPMFL